MRQWPDQDNYEKIPEKVSTTSDGNVDRKETPKESSLLSEYQKNIQAWRDFFKALNGDEEAIKRKMQSFQDDKPISIGSFEYLLTATDEEVEKEYTKYFEPQTSKFYLGGVLATLLSNAFKKWFSCEKNKTPDEIDENTMKNIQIVDRILEIKNKKETEQNLEKLHEDLSK